MSQAIHDDDDADLTLIQSRRVAVIGYGNQGQAHALSLRDSGVDVRVGLPEGSKSAPAAADEGLPVLAPREAAAEAELVMVLAPDTAHRAVYAEIAPSLDEGDALFFGHGFSVRYELVRPPSTVDVALVAPKGPGDLVRRQFVDGKGVPCLVAVHADATGGAWPLALSYAKAIGGTRAGVITTTFAEETETGLFGEQAVRCGGVSALMHTGFEVLTEAGYAPEVAYFACLHELKLIVDLMVEGGLARMWESVSDTAEYGGLTRGPQVITPAIKDQMRTILTGITDGTFAREWIAEDEAGRPAMNRLAAKARQHPIEHTGRTLRALMPWLDDPGA